MKIGVIDSGVGGLTVVKSLIDQGFTGDVVYFGDLVNCPYGDKSKEALMAITKPIVQFLATQSIDYLALACNTISSQILSEIKKWVDVPIVDVVSMGVRGALETSQNHRVLVLATTGTVKSGAYLKLITAQSPITHVHSVACPKWVPFIEQGITGQALQDGIMEIFQEVNGFSYDTVILGCTHYPFVEQEILKNVPYGANIVNPSWELAKEIVKLWAGRDVRQGELSVYVSKDSAVFQDILERCIGTGYHGRIRYRVVPEILTLI